MDAFEKFKDNLVGTVLQKIPDNVCVYTGAELKKAWQEVTRQKDAEIDSLKTIIENLEMANKSFVDANEEKLEFDKTVERLKGYQKGLSKGIAGERKRIIAVLCEVVVDGQFEFLKDCVEKESK